MPKTVTTTHTTDLALRRLEVIPTTVGYRVIVRAHVVESENGAPVSTSDIVYDGDVAGYDLTALYKEVNAIVQAIRARDFS
jgi:hypothetical protein